MAKRAQQSKPQILPPDIHIRFSLNGEEIIPSTMVWPVDGTLVVVQAGSFTEARRLSQELRARIPTLPRTRDDLERATEMVARLRRLPDADAIFSRLPDLTPRSAADIIPPEAMEDPDGFIARFRDAVLAVPLERGRLTLNEATWLAIACAQGANSDRIPELRQALTGSGNWSSATAIRRVLSGQEMRVTIVVRSGADGLRTETHVVAPPGWSREEIRRGLLMAMEALQKLLAEVGDGDEVPQVAGQEDVKGVGPDCPS